MLDYEFDQHSFQKWNYVNIFIVKLHGDSKTTFLLCAHHLIALFFSILDLIKIKFAIHVLVGCVFEQTKKVLSNFKIKAKVLSS